MKICPCSRNVSKQDGNCVAGLQWHGRTALAEAEDFVQAYHRLWKRAVRRFLRPGAATRSFLLGARNPEE